VATFFENLLSAHDPAQVETFCYADVRAPDRVTARLKASARNWRDSISLDDEKLADLIRQDRIDILVDLAGHTDGNRLLVFARKPAPVQVSHLGYVGTSGLSTMDYRLTDEHLDPPGDDRGVSQRETGSPAGDVCVFPSAGGCAAGFSAAGAGARRGHLRIAQHARQAHTDYARLLGESLASIPDSHLLLVARGATESAIQTRICKPFIEHQVDPSRIEFVGQQTFADYLAIHARIDILLDPFPVNGHTVTCNAIWMGVPPVSLAGRNYPSRLGVSVLKNLGLEELIAGDVEHYVRIAARWRATFRASRSSAKLCGERMQSSV
jgi:predicted O-linked N-acetylglucosamine transferase (SPINDLY family)